MLSSSSITKYTILFMAVAFFTIIFGGLLTFWYNIVSGNSSGNKCLSL